MATLPSPTEISWVALHVRTYVIISVRFPEPAGGMRFLTRGLASDRVADTRLSDRRCHVRASSSERSMEDVPRCC